MAEFRPFSSGVLMQVLIMPEVHLPDKKGTNSKFFWLNLHLQFHNLDLVKDFHFAKFRLNFDYDELVTCRVNTIIHLQSKCT